MLRTPALALAFTAIALTPACAQDTKVDTADKAAIEQIVRNYILENPEILEEGFMALQAKREAEEAADARSAIAASQKALFQNASDHSIGPADAEVVLVEFFDYRCGYCKRTVDFVSALPAKHDGNVRVVFKELPILSPESEQAALAALAAGEQGKYFEMHRALMQSRGKYTPAEIDKIAMEVGVDVGDMRAAMKSDKIKTQLADGQALARTLGVTATPTFIIGDELIAGAATDRIEELIKEELGS